MKNEKLLIFLSYVCLFVLLAPSSVFAETEEKSKKYDIPGFIGKSKKSGDIEYGPIRLREKYQDWDIELLDANGAFITYTRDRIENTGTWQSQGSLIYPITIVTDSSESTLLPTIQWNYFNLTSDAATDTEELTFLLPVNYILHHNIEGEGDTTLDSYFYFAPFYLTDFDFDGAMVGAQFTYEPKLLINGFQIGWWHGLCPDCDYADKWPGSIFYLFRIIPGLTYGRVLTESSYINRQEKDDMFALTTSLELRFKLFGKSSPWEMFGTYDLWYVFSGDPDGYADILEIGSTWWFNDNVGLKLKYQKGDTILTNKEIDLVTLNLELRL